MKQQPCWHTSGGYITKYTDFVEGMMIFALLEEITPFIAGYSLFAVIVCIVIQFVHYKCQESHLPFSRILIGNALLFGTSLLLFSIVMICIWYGVRLNRSESAFVWFAAIAVCVIVSAMSLITQRYTELVVRHPWSYAIVGAFFITLPLFFTALYFTVLSGVNFGY